MFLFLSSLVGDLFFRGPIHQQFNGSKEIDLRIKIKKINQEYSAICKVTVWPYWKPKGSWFYRSLPSIILEGREGGKYHPSKIPWYRELAEAKFKEEALRQVTSTDLKWSVTVGSVYKEKL